MLSLVLLTSMSIALGDDGAIAESPPWEPHSEYETEVGGQSPEFGDCREALRKISESYSVALVDSTTYWESKVWGHVTRQAGLYSDDPLRSSKLRVVCWTKLGDTRTRSEIIRDTDALRDWTPD